MIGTRLKEGRLLGISVQSLRGHICYNDNPYMFSFSKRFVVPAFCVLLVFFVFVGLSYGQGANLRKGPYLLLAATGAKTVDNTGMTVYWQTDSTPAAATIAWGTSPGSYGPPVSVAENGSGQDEHQFSYTMTGLNMGTMYYYQITVDGTSASGSFRTPPDPASTSLTFYGYGDIRGNELFSDTEFTQHSLVEERIMSDVRQNVSTQQTVLINASDFVNCGMDEHYWDRQYFNRTLTGSMDFMANLPLIAPVGNHERYWAGIKDGSGNCNLSLYPYTGMTITNACHVIEPTNHGELFNKYFPYAFYPVPKGPGAYKDYYYLNDYGTARFLMLDTFFSPFTSGSPQYTWLAGNIRSSTRWNIPVFHAPMWAARYPIDPAKAVELRDALGPVFESNYVPLVIQGHDHFYSRLLVNGITYLTLGGGGAALSDITPEDPASAPYTVKSAKLYHYARFEISGNTMTVTVMNVPGPGVVDIPNPFIDTFKILPPTTNISPANDQTTSSCTPTLHASPFVSQDGATHQASQWIVRDASDNKIVHVTSCIDASTQNSYSCFDTHTRNLTSYAPPPLKCGQHYQWQVVYKDSNGNTTQASIRTPFQTPAHTGDTNAYGIPVTANQVNDKSGAPIGVINGGNVTALQADTTFRASVPQIDAVAAIIYAGSVTDLSGNIIPINPAGFSLVKTRGGIGQPFAIVAGGTGAVGNIMPISNTGYTVSDNSGTMKQVATFDIPSGGYLPYGIFDFIVNVTEGSTAKIVIVPPEPFTQGTKWYRLDATVGPLKEYPYFEVNSQGNGILTITDNGAGDSDQRLGVIRDTGGPVSSGGSSSGSSGCFIATAAFGSNLHPYVAVLTSFRDNFLNTHAAGRSFVAWYYRISPPIADAIRTNEAAKEAVRILLVPPIGFSLLCLKIGFIPALLVILLCGIIMVIGIRRLYHFRHTSRV